MSVKTDEVNLNVNINGDAARDQLNNLKKSAADLRFEIKNNLVKGTQEYIDASAQLKTVNADIVELKQQIGLTALSEKELAAELRKVSALRGSVTPLTEEWHQLDAQMQEIVLRQNEITAASLGVTSAMEAEASEVGIFGERFKKIGESLLAFFAIEKVVELFKSVAEEADHAEQASEGLHLALENIGRIDAFDRLTRKAEDFAKSYKDLKGDDIKDVFTKLIDYGKLSENQMTSLTQVIIDFSRKQKISLSDATDVMTKALEGNGKALKGYGINIKDGSDATERLNIILTSLGSKVQGAEEVFENTSKGMREGFSVSVQEAEKHVGLLIERLFDGKDAADEMFDDAKEKTDGYKDSLTPLLSRYDELKSKATLNKDEQTELHGIINKIVQILPSAAEGVDKYGNALDINRKKAEDFFVANQKFLQQKEGDAITSLTSKTRDLIEAYIKAGETVKKLNAGDSDALHAAGFAGQSLESALQRQQQIHASSAEELIKNADILTQKYGVQLPKDIGSAVDAAKQWVQSLQGVNNKLNTGAYDAASIESLTQKLTTLTKGSKEYLEVQKQIEDLQNKKKKLGTGDPDDQGKSKYDERKAAAETFNKQTRDLQNQALTSSETANQRELDDIKYKYAERLIAYKELIAKYPGIEKHLNITLAGIEADRNTQLAATRKEQENKMMRDGLSVIAKQYNEELEQQKKHTEDFKIIEAQNLNAGLISEKQYQANIAKLDQDGAAQQLAIAKTYAGNRVMINGEWVSACEQADKDVTKITTDEVKKQTEVILAQYKQREEVQKLFSDLNKKVAQSDIDTALALAKKGSDEEYKLQQEKIVKEKNLQLQSLDDEEHAAQMKVVQGAVDESEQRLAIFEKYNKLRDNAEALAEKRRSDLKKQHELAELAKIQQDASRVLSFATTLSNALTAIENGRLQKEINANNAKEAAYKKQLDGKLMNETQYQKKVDKLNQDMDDKKKKIEKEAFERNKVLQIAQTIINGAAGIIKTWIDPGFPMAIPLTLALGIETAAQVATIASTQPSFGTGGLLDGPKHSSPSKGMPVIDPATGKPKAFFEGGEALINARAMGDNTPMSLTGTPKQIASKLNSMYGGISFADGAIAQLNPAWQNITPTINTTAVASSFGGGGYFGSSNNTTATTPGQSDARLTDVIAAIAAMHTDINNWKGNLRANFVYRDLQDGQHLLDLSQRQSGLNQNK